MDPRRRFLGYVILYVSDLEQAVAWYRDVIGIPLKFVDNDYAEFATSPTKFALYARERLPQLIGRGAEPGDPAGEICLIVDDVDAEADRLARLGASILSGPTDRAWGHRTLHVEGPDRHIVELAQEIPRSTKSETAEA